MPELPEVETVVRDLRPLLTGRRFAKLWSGSKPLRQPWNPDWEPCLLGRIVAGLRRRGKWILVELDDASTLVVHLGMTGQFTVAAASTPQPAHTHLVFTLDDGHDELRYRDIRRFGSVRHMPAGTDVELFLGERLGPEPFDLGRSWFRSRLAETARPLKAILLDQTIVAGVGNIYADEALHAAQLHPARLGHSLAPAEAERLRQAIVAVLTRAIEQRGSTIRNYVGGTGLSGGYQDEFRAYGRTDAPCERCATPIARIRLAGRSTHYCPACQPEPDIRGPSRESDP